jgi:mRNA degradation ribonuclease J1/J2
MTDSKLQVIPLGGLGEFGMNMTAIRYGADIIVVDCGMMFPEAGLLGVDLVMPDLTFLKENEAQIRALILTHGHEDHIGAVPFFLSEIDIPVYGTDFTLALVDRRLEEYDLDQEPRFIRVKPKQIVEIGPFKVEFVHVTHSIVSCVALAITTPLGVIIHTGDFKVDPPPPITNCSTCTRWPSTASAACCCCFRIRPTRTGRDTRNPSARCDRGWKRSSIGRTGGWWFRASARRFTGFSWCWTWRASSSGAWR